MKLKNKISGEIKEFVIFDGNEMQAGVTLKDLAQEWEDYEEPKHSYYLTGWGEVNEYSKEGFNINRKLEIGNYFETKEEAEKVVEKLKAWKRLKDRGFRFTDWYSSSGHLHTSFDFSGRKSSSENKLLNDELDLLFGGEE